MASRSIDDLSPACRDCAGLFLSRSLQAGFDLLVTCTYRSPEDQAILYAQGRSAPGRIVTWARPWDSRHQYREALDVVPMVDGKPLWSTKGNDLKIWQAVGALGEGAGLEWAGRWPASKREFAHFQMKAKK